MPIKTDRELVVAYVEAGDESSFSELVVRHTQMVYRTCFRMLGNIHDTQDATQAVFIVLARKAGTLQREGNLGGWLHKVARNVALQALERRTTSATREKEVTMWHETVSDEAGLDSHADAALLFLDQELAGLSAVLRQAVVLRYLQGNSEKQAAELAACPQGTLSRRASDGIAKLRQRLAKRGVALSGMALAGLLTSEASASVPETLLPSILATVKTAVATTAAGTAATTTAGMLAKGAMKAMFIAQVKMAALVTAVSLVVGGAGGAIVAQEVAQRKPAEQPVGDQTSPLLDKMGRIIIPEIQFRQASMEDVVRFLSEASVTFDTITPVGQKKGVSLLLYGPLLKDDFARWKEPSITLTARNISMLEALRIVTESAGLTYLVGKEYARDCVRICRAGEIPPDSFRQQGVEKPAKTRKDTCDLVIPEVEFRHASLSNVVEVLTEAAKLHDPKKAGVRMIVEGPKTHSTYITLSARNVTLRDVLTTICMDTGMTLQIETHKDGQVVRLISGENTEGQKRGPRDPSKAFDK